MLKLVNINKNYVIKNAPSVPALKNINIDFDNKGFTAILGQSGCGKTTLLNIISGLDQYSSGDLIIEGKSTKNYSPKEWDNYRNKEIGIIFQQYNLIPHLTVLGNVELSLTLAGINKKERTKRALFAIEQVGLTSQKNKYPNQLSGGQMQRVAIARALVNNPRILICDEPTGALDSQTSLVVMNILKEVSVDRLVIMVTHNEELAHNYCDRIIRLLDGEIIADEANESTVKLEEVEHENTSNNEEQGVSDLTVVGEVVNMKEVKKKEKLSRMSFGTSLKLSSKNLWTKKGRTAMVGVAGSFGIIGVSLVLALQNGFTNYMDNMERQTLSSYPLSIEKYVFPTANDMGDMMGETNKPTSFPSDGSFTVKESHATVIKTNSLTPEYIQYVMDMPNQNVEVASIKKNYALNSIVVTKYKDENNKDNFKRIHTVTQSFMDTLTSSTSYWQPLPGDEDFVRKQYEVIEGKYPEKANEIVVIVDKFNSISENVMTSLGYDEDDFSKYSKLSDLVYSSTSATKKEYKLYKNEDYFSLDKVEGLDYKEGMTQEEAEGLLDAALKDQNLSKYIQKGLKFKRYAKVDDFINLMVEVSEMENATEEQQKEYLQKFLSFFDTKGELDNENPNLNDLFNEAHLITKYKGTVNDTLKMTELWNSTKDMTDEPIRVVGVLRQKKDVTIPMLSTGIYYTEQLSELVSGNDIDKQGIYEKERLEAMNHNIDIFGETREDGTRNSNPVCPYGYLYCDEAKYLIQDDLSDNLFLTLNYKPLFDGIKEHYNLDPSNEQDQRSIAYLDSFAEALSSPNYVTEVDKLMQDVTPLTSNPNDSDIAKFGKYLKIVYDNRDNPSGDPLYPVAFLYVTDVVRSVMSTISVNDLFDFVSYGASGVKYNSSNLSNYTNERGAYGTDNTVHSLTIYPKNFDSKKQIMKYLDAWNKRPENKDNQILCNDLAGTATDLVGDMVNIVSSVLIVFASISLVVSSVMIGIITFVSVIERKKEIGILRSIGARKVDVGTLFIAESTIIGALSGLIGVVFSLLVEIPINIVLNNIYPDVGLGMIANLSFPLCLLMIFISMFLTFISGLIPSAIAARKNPVECLRSE